jgi:hypothetical protein
MDVVIGAALFVLVTLPCWLAEKRWPRFHNVFSAIEALAAIAFFIYVAVRYSMSG